MRPDFTAILPGFSRNSIHLIPSGNAQMETGGTHFGGSPDVPAGFSWPYFDTDTIDDSEIKPRPLSFIAQFDCAALSPLDTDGLLPHEGLLSFFYELGSQRWGYDPNDAGCARVYWFHKSVLSPARFPEDMEAYYRLPLISFQARQKLEYPGYEDISLALPAAATSSAYSSDGVQLWDEYEKVRETFLGPEEPDSRHKLLGWPDVIQNNMTQECELVSRGYSTGRGWGGIPIEVRQASAEPSLDKWRLLFQLDTIGAGDFELMFGDSGSIYFYIRKEDLAARRFDRVWLIQQCC